MRTGGTPSPRKKARDEEDLSVNRLNRKKAFATSKGRHGVNDASNAKAEVLVEDDLDNDDASSGRPCRETRAAKGGCSANDPADWADDGRRPTKVPSKSGRGVPTHAAVGRRGVPVHAVGGRGVGPPARTCEAASRTSSFASTARGLMQPPIGRTAPGQRPLTTTT